MNLLKFRSVTPYFTEISVPREHIAAFRVFLLLKTMTVFRVRAESSITAFLLPVKARNIGDFAEDWAIELLGLRRR